MAGKDIPLISRILSIADAWDAMRSDRSYREALSKEEAINELKKNKSIQFDRRIVNVFMNNLEKIVSKREK